jgi:PAS domain S-box-containing protein
MKTIKFPIRFPFSRPQAIPAAPVVQFGPDPLRAAEQRYVALARSLVRYSEDAIVTKDMEGTITSWNAAATRMFGWSEEEMIGRSVFEIVPPHLRAEEDDIMRCLRAGKAVAHLETKRLTAAGHVIDVRVSVSPLRDIHGTMIGASKIARNITSERTTERARTQLAAIVESSDDAIIGKGLDGVINSWNHAAVEMFGYPADEMIGKSILTIIPKALQGEELAIIADVLEGRRVDHFETMRQHRDGTLIAVSLSVSPVRNDHGEIVGAAKILRDLSRRRSLETSLLQARKVATGARTIVRSADEFEHTINALSNLVCVTKNRCRFAEEVWALMLQAEAEINRLSRLTQDTVALTQQTSVDAQISITKLSETLAEQSSSAPAAP